MEWKSAFVFVLLFVGGMFAEWARAGWRAKRKNRAQPQTDIERRQKSDSFQRETLLDLQNTLHHCMHLATTGYIVDRSTNQWKSNQTEGLSQEFRAALAKADLLSTRVLDDQLRQQVEDLIQFIDGIGFATTSDESSRALRGPPTFTTCVAATLG